MTSRPSSLQALFAEMKRRRVFKVMVVYGAVAFVILQIADIAFEPLGLPAWAMTLVLVLAMIGFPLAIVLAWAFESTPEGMRRTAPAGDEELREIVSQPRSRRWASGLLALASVVLLFGTGWYMGGGGRRDDERAPNRLVSDAHAADLRAIAALPLEDVNGTDENRLIALGIHGDLLTRLSRIGSLRVTSRTSVREYEDSELSLREIADELGVEYILEGSVQSSGNQVRVIVSLVDADADEKLLWSEQYDHAVTPDNLFDIQAEIAQAVVRELEARLTPEEEAVLASLRPAANAVAQQWYYRGLDAWMSGNDAAPAARDAFRRAVDLDSGYNAAWSALAKLESRLVWLGEDRRGEARAAMERTEALAPRSVEAFLARGYFEYYGRQNYPAALSAFRAAERLAPSDAEVAVALGLILRREGDWDASTKALRRALALDPRNTESLYTLGENFRFLGAYQAADEVLDRALMIDPQNSMSRAYKVSNLVDLERDVGPARRLADELALDPGEFNELQALSELAILAGAYDEALAHYAAFEPEGVLAEMERQFGKARTHGLMADEPSDAAIAAADSTIALLDRMSDTGVWGTTYRGLAHAVAGHPARALSLLEEAKRSVRSWEDHVDNTTWALRIIEGYGRLGEVERGFDLLEEMIDRPTVDLGVGRLLLSPAYDPYRSDPRFDDLVKRRGRFEADAAAWAEANGPWLP